MKYLDYQENKKQGTEDFPIAFYHIEPTDARYEMPYHWHKQIEIIRVLEGTFKLILNGEIHELHKGGVVYIQDGISHGGVPENCIYECVVFDIKILQKSEYRTSNFIRNLSSHRYYVAADALDMRDRQFDYVNILFDVLGKSDDGYEMETVAALFLMYADIYKRRLYTSNEGNVMASYVHSAKFKNVLDFIETHYAENISLEDMAESAGVSPKYFCRYFKEMSDKTPIEYLNYYRIERACEQLAINSVSVTDAALGNGFNDISYFIKTFKKQKGVTPRQYKTSRFR